MWCSALLGHVGGDAALHLLGGFRGALGAGEVGRGSVFYDGQGLGVHAVGYAHAVVELQAALGYLAHVRREVITVFAPAGEVFEVAFYLGLGRAAQGCAAVHDGGILGYQRFHEGPALLGVLCGGAHAHEPDRLYGAGAAGAGKAAESKILAQGVAEHAQVAEPGVRCV